METSQGATCRPSVKGGGYFVGLSCGSGVGWRGLRQVLGFGAFGVQSLFRVSGFEFWGFGGTLGLWGYIGFTHHFVIRLSEWNNGCASSTPPATWNAIACYSLLQPAPHPPRPPPPHPLMLAHV